MNNRCTALNESNGQRCARDARFEDLCWHHYQKRDRDVTAAALHPQPDPDFVRWLSNLVRCDEWNKVMRSPARWKEMYDSGMTVTQAAIAPERWRVKK